MAANGTYGTRMPAHIGDVGKYVDMFYSYSPTRNSSDVDASAFTRLDIGNLQQVNGVTGLSDSIIEGLFNLKLPMDIFGRKGYYTIYIKPKEVPATIADVSVLRDFPNIRGVVLNVNDLDSNVQGDASKNNSMVGYRIIYIDDDGTRMDETRLITSNNRCEPVVSVSTSNNSKTYTYQYNNGGGYTFMTVTPSMASSYNAASSPFIGKAGQGILLVNTLFEPVCVEIEMIDNDADTLANMIGGSQLRDLNNGVLTTFDENGNICMQHELSTLKATETGDPQYEVKERRTENIDFSQTINDKV